MSTTAATPPPSFVHYVGRKTLAHTLIGMAIAAAYLVPNQLVAGNAELRTLVSPHSSAKQSGLARAGSERLEAKMRAGGCRRTALPGNARPASALVLDQGVNRADLHEVAARARFSSVEEAWAIHTGDQPGTVLAFCLSKRG